MTETDASAVRACIASLTPPFGASVRIELLDTSATGSDVPHRLGTYGVIRGAQQFLAAAYHDTPLAEEAMGYVFEQALLRCTELGLGTCWVGGTFKQGDFATAMRLGPEEHLRIVSPVGYAALHRTLVDTAFGAIVRRKSRQSFESRFFDRDWEHPMTLSGAGPYGPPLELVRLAPSARNKQPWRAVKEGATVHFYRDSTASRFTRIELGIALCHFELACRQAESAGHYKVLASPVPSPVRELKYVVSWVGHK
jgi:nitroreductase